MILVIKNGIILIFVSIIQKLFYETTYLGIDFILFFIIYIGFYYGLINAQIYGFILGSVQDFLNFDPLLLGMTLTIIGFPIEFFKKKIYIETYLSTFIFVFILFCFKQLIFMFLVVLFSYDPYMSYVYNIFFSLEGFFKFLFLALLNALTAYFIFYILRHGYFRLSKIKF